MGGGFAERHLMALEPKQIEQWEEVKGNEVMQMLLKYVNEEHPASKPGDGPPQLQVSSCEVGGENRWMTGMQAELGFFSRHNFFSWSASVFCPVATESRGISMTSSHISDTV